MLRTRLLVVFFFQAEDGIRDLTVTGVQTCALPIFSQNAIGIDLGADGVTANDTGDGDAGANDLQNFSVLSEDRKSTRLNSSHSQISYAVFCLKKQKLCSTIVYTSADAVHCIDCLTR